MRDHALPFRSLAFARQVLLASCVAALAACSAFPDAAPQADAGAGTRALKKLPRRSDRAAVTVYEVRSTVSGVEGRNATDMFKTALVQSGRFRVVERARLNEGVAREKQLNAQGVSSGTTAQRQITGAEYVFEVAITEANANETQRAGGVTVAGMQVGGGTNRDSLAVDVRIVQVATAEVVDAVHVLKPIGADQASVSGVGSLLGTIMSRKGRDTTYTPDVNLQQQRKQGLDNALRAALDEAVLQLAKRFEP